MDSSEPDSSITLDMIRKTAISRRGGVRVRGGRLPPIRIRDVVPTTSNKKVKLQKYLKGVSRKNSYVSYWQQQALELQSYSQDFRRQNWAYCLKATLGIQGLTFTTGESSWNSLALQSTPCP
ncbi:hypothetical protein AVEN_272482-1 [Araneus ventricosus]|uniref:Uncharacterized protein n=1 Tax=Araneus ventricosus TaxID=182803 RepID=A0A4Y2KA01_ARAVE|nr:hypothetical protein AVEN_272482-1 [Araneus ventricosus]